VFIVTGGAGFIGNVMVWKLNQLGITDILIVDHLGDGNKWKNLVRRKYSDYMHRDQFLDLISSGRLDARVDGIFHMGACSATTEKNADFLMANNYRYTKVLGEWALEHDARFIYASSAATYGNGTLGFRDDLDTMQKLVPLNMYGYSKQVYDLHAHRNGLLDKIAGIKFFNVFGPNEYHKGDMSSVVFKSFNQITETGMVKLFRSANPAYKDGEQLRDFVYVKDCVDVLWWLYENKQVNGIFNLGTGVARSWKDLVSAVFSSMKLPVKIEFVDMPPGLKKAYQYFTLADMSRLRESGCPVEFRSLEAAVQDYVCGYLSQPDPFL